MLCSHSGDNMKRKASDKEKERESERGTRNEQNGARDKVEQRKFIAGVKRNDFDK